MAAAFADDARQVVLTVGEFVDHPLIAFGLFERREVFALHVFDQSDLERILVRTVTDDDRQFVELGDLGRTPAAFAGDDLEGASGLRIGPHY